jgi:malonate-semialdehyde dehydrogenase (acetylating)/methylmalonate-semialdehyde dehydrogenase
MKYPKVQNYINGSFVDASSMRSLQVISPLDGNLLSEVPMSTAKDLDQCCKARPWPLSRNGVKHPLKIECRFFSAYKYFAEKNMKELAEY